MHPIMAPAAFHKAIGQQYQLQPRVQCKYKNKGYLTAKTKYRGLIIISIW